MGGIVHTNSAVHDAAGARTRGLLHNPHPMSATYKKLLDEWRAAADETRKAQQGLKEKFDLFLQGRGPEPEASEIERVQALRQAENAKLHAAMAYVRSSAYRSR